MLSINFKEIKEFEADLKVFARRAYPFATKGTINGAAFGAQKAAQANVRRSMTTRNRFTERSIQVEPSRTLRVSRQAATVGSTAPYMEDQEFGGIVAKEGRYGAVIPTSWAANQEGARPRTKLPTRANKLANIQLAKRIRTGKTSRRQEAFLRALLAANQGDKYVLIPGGGRASTGIYRVWGRGRKVKGQYRRIKMKMVYSLRRNPVSVPATPWLGPAVVQVEPTIPRIYLRELKRQAKRHRLFR